MYVLKFKQLFLSVCKLDFNTCIIFCCLMTYITFQLGLYRSQGRVGAFEETPNYITVSIKQQCWHRRTISIAVWVSWMYSGEAYLICCFLLFPAEPVQSKWQTWHRRKKEKKNRNSKLDIHITFCLVANGQPSVLTCPRVKKKKKKKTTSVCVVRLWNPTHNHICFLKTPALIVLHQRRASKGLLAQLQTASMEVYSNFLWREKM